MSKRNVASARSTMLVFEVDPTECPFREFRDNELSQDYWGLGPAACRATALNKTAPKLPADYVWVDDQIQPLPRSVRQYLHGWVRAEDLAVNRWGAEVVMFDENNGGKMSIMEMQLSHAQVLLRSSFCRQVLSACYMLERVEGFMVEHQWENFIFNIGPEGWTPRYHIYSPGMKPGGGPQHKPGLYKNGCYLVRLFYLGTWRCVWVSDQVPIDATGSPLLPFSPLCSRLPPRPGTKVSAMGTPNVVYLWALLLCKALLKLAAPDMNSDEDSDCIEDELMPEFNIMYALTGTLNLRFFINDPEEAWKLITAEVPVFGWDDDDDTQTSTIKSKSTKKPTTKETAVIRRSSFGTLVIADTKNCPAYTLPGITPAHEMSLLVTMARDLPLKKPLPEPDVPQWKTYRWVDWARRHGLYEAYDCPRTRFLKVNGLMKLSYAPHLLDVQSTQSVTRSFREQNDKTNPLPVSKKGAKEQTIRPNMGASTVAEQMKEELREWVQYNALQELIKGINIYYYPSMFKYTTATSHPSIRITKALPNKALDITVPKTAPLYLQIDSPDVNVLKISLSMLHPRVLFNAGIPVVDYIEQAYLILEIFEWFVDCELPVAKSFVRTKGYDSVEVKIKPGRHFCRLWIHSRMAWHVALLSESQLLLGTRDLIQAAAVKECPWASKFLSTLGTAFSSWIRMNRSNTNIVTADREFYKSYKPDLQWDDKAVGYNKCNLHWMFRQAIQSFLIKKLTPSDFHSVCSVLRRYFCDPHFGFSEKPKLLQSLREIASMDPCDCEISEPEDILEELNEQQITEEKPVVDPNIMEQLLTQPTEPNTTQVCDLATEELSCGVLKNEREKILKMHEAAGIIQAYWRGKWARKCLREHVVVTPEFLKLIMESTFGNLESLSALMNEFFGMFPGTRNAYSVASALCGVSGLHQYHGTAPVTPQCKWIPYFQGVFYCHAPVKVHFDVQSSLRYSSIAVYNNDTGEQIPQAYNAHTTFYFSPNDMGYTVMGHGTLNHPLGHNSECHWQLSVLSSVAGNLHICDNDLDSCKETPLPSSSKFHIDEIFLPNRRNILGGIQIAVTKHEAVSFRACATSSDLEITATLSTKTSSGDLEELDHCAGKGEIYWPFIRLEPMDISISSSGKQVSLRGNINTAQKGRAQSVGAKNKSNTKLKDKNAPLEPKQYLIQVIAPAGWPLTLNQWKRVDEIRNSNESCKIETPSKKTTKDKEKTPSAKEKPLVYSVHQPLPGDAYVELECAFAIGGGATGRREDERDLEFAAARRSWDANEPGRNLRGAQIRKEFRAEFLEATTPPPSESFHTLQEETMREEIEAEEERKDLLNMQQRPTPATESELIEMAVESEEEGKYLTFPEQLRDKFIPLYFLPFCMKERDEELTVLVTPDIAEAAKQDRQLRIEAAMERMRELQVYNEIYVLGRQKTRSLLLEKLFVDSQWSPDLQDAFERRDDAIATETLNRTQSATKKKQEGKKK